MAVDPVQLVRRQLQDVFGELEQRGHDAAPYLRYAVAFGDQLSMGDPAPSAVGLDQEAVRDIRRIVSAEWRRRVWRR